MSWSAAVESAAYRSIGPGKLIVIRSPRVRDCLDRPRRIKGRWEVSDRVAAAVLLATGDAPRIEEISLAGPGPHQARVRLAAAGVCHSDLSIAQGRLRHALPV